MARLMIRVGGRSWRTDISRKWEPPAQRQAAGLGPIRTSPKRAVLTEERREVESARSMGACRLPARWIAHPVLADAAGGPMEELGMDYLITYPTWGLTVHTIPDEEDAS